MSLSAARDQEVSDRDRQVLRAVLALRLVTGGQLMRLVFGSPTATSQNARIARRCLQRLTEAGLLWRLHRRVGGIRAGSSSYVYAVSPAGARALGESIGRGRQREPSLTFLNHTLAVSEVYVRLYEALYQHKFDELHAETEPRCWRNLEDGSSAVLRPDLLVTASTPTEDVWAFVEVDLGTEHVAAVQRKVALYEVHWRSGREQARLGGFPQVMWLVPDTRRQRQLRGYLRRAARDRPGLHTVVLQDDFINQLVKGGDHE